MADEDVLNAEEADAGLRRDSQNGSDTQHSRDPEAASRALSEIQELLRRHRVVLDLAHRQTHGEGPERHELVEQLVERQHLNELRARLDQLHPADVAFILEALPFEERMIVWDLVKAERDGEILLEVSDAVRESLIESMDRSELVDAVEKTPRLIGARGGRDQLLGGADKAAGFDDLHERLHRGQSVHD